MRIHIGPIKGNRGASLEAEFEEPMDSIWQSGETVATPVRVRTQVTNTGRSYWVHGDIQVEGWLPCSRCLEPAKFQLETSFQEEFYPHAKVQSPRRGDVDEEGEAPPDDDAVNTFEGDTIQLDDVVREYLVLAQPAKVFCHDECVGICPHCGVNRNQTACGCADEIVDPRLAGLRRLLEQSPSE